MQVGDLVELSAYGLKHGGHFRGLEGKKGLVIGVRPGTVSLFLKIHWFFPNSRPYFINRRELKHVKVKKTLDRTPSV
jgi:hypothetical protein